MHNSIVPVIQSTRTVFLVRTRGLETWFAFHDVARKSQLTSTSLAVFLDERAAVTWALSLEAYRDEHGQYPPRDVRRVKRLPWVRVEAPGKALDRPKRLDVVRLPFTDVAAMIKGTGINCRMVLDPANLYHKIDVVYPEDRAATCSRLEYDYTRKSFRP